MLESAWLFIGATTVLTTGFAVSTQTQAASLYDEYADPIAMVAGLVGFFSWLMLAYGALDLEVVASSSTLTFNMPPLSIWCTMMSLIPLYVALTGPLEVIKRATTAQPDDV